MFEQSFNNISNYRLGINGLVVDVAGVGTNTTAADFQFAVWNGIDLPGFVATSATPTLTFLPRDGVGGSTRIKIEFTDGAIKNTWLRVTMLANANTGLDADYTFYFGNAIAEMDIGNTGNPTTIRVNATDTSRVRQNQSTASNSVPVTSIFDVNKDGRVNATDTSIVRQNQSNSVLRFFTAPSSFSFAASMSSASSNSLATPNLSNAASTKVDLLQSSTTNIVASSLQLERSTVASSSAQQPSTQIQPILASSNSISAKSSTTQGSTISGLADAMIWQATDQFFATYQQGAA